MTAKKKIVDPTEVKVVAPEPLPVKIEQPKPVDVKVVGKIPAVPNPPLKPTTTAQEDIVTAGQRRINMIWEVTQALIAVMITASNIYCVFKKIDSGNLDNAFFLIVSMYFVRTNHKLIGGVGEKYKGR